MKKIFLLATLVVFSYCATAQSIDLRRKIEVSGTAEKEVTPDIINVSISLQEYMNGKTKITIDQLEGQLESAVKDAGIAKEDFTINNVSGYDSYYQKKKKPDFLESKQYSIRFHDLNKFNQIMNGVDPKGIESTNISSYDYSKMPELKRKLKIQALLAARDKAAYLLNSIGEKLGGVININEVDNSDAQNPVYSNRIMVANTSSVDNSNASDINFKKIKLSFQINAVFEILK